MDVFTWSMPFVVEKVAELLLVFLNLVDDAEAEEREEAERQAAVEKEKKREAIRNKVKGVTKMLRLFKNIRQEREEVMKLGAVSPKGESLPATLATVKDPEVIDQKIKTSLTSFDGVKSVDIINEKRPVGIDKALQTARDVAQTPDGIKRRQSRDSIRRSQSGDLTAAAKAASAAAAAIVAAGEEPPK
jgi:serine/threonine-protein phosphatase 2B catalytic subunit